MRVRSILRLELLYHSPITITGSRFGAYEVGELLGAGGMGEVYRARDTRLQRDVAIKILPESFAADPDRFARFTREAQTLAALNHPHIAHVHGLEESGAMRALVMEFVDGETLAARIARGAMPLDEALAVARQIADALESAHEKGIVHRDLKPANIMLGRDGAAKVLDFGLAKALDARSSADIANSPTLTFHATQMGVVLGTAAYMSPEQARGREVDKRSDVWSFGCVFYEMVTGRRAFHGEDATDTIAAVVRADPDWSALPGDVPEPIRLLLKRCLEKDRRARISDIAVARFLLAEPIGPVPSASPAEPARGQRSLWLAAAALAGAALAAAATWTATRPAPAPGLRAVRFTLTPPEPLSIFRFARDIAITPDGSAIIYRTGLNRIGELNVRPIDSLAARKVDGTHGRDPFVSPDGRWIGYFTPTELRKVAVAGGPSILVHTLGENARGGSWGSDDRIVFARIVQTKDGLVSVPASGGPETVLTHIDAATGGGPHAHPFVLPNGRGVLYTILAYTGGLQNAQIAVLDSRTGQSKVVVRGGTSASYVESGHIVYAAAGSLLAAPFDLQRLEVTGDAIPVVDHVMVGGNGAANYSVSRQGALIYLSESAAQVEQSRRLVWVTRDGREEAIDAPLRAYAVARLSPDGTRAALDIRDERGNSDIWTLDLVRHTLSPLGLDPNQDMSPLWTPDGKRVIWTSTRAGGNPNLVWQAADGTGRVERLSTSLPAQFPTAITPDGSRVLIFSGDGRDATSTVDLGTVLLGPSPAADRAAEPLLVGSAMKLNADLSPDGRWLAYQSNESGQRQIYVRPYPAVDTGRTQISAGGGTRPMWSRDGRELFYLDENDLLTSVAVQTTTAGFRAGVPRTVLKTKYFLGASTRGYDLRSFDVSRDGQRFLMIKDSAPATADTPLSITVVLNWFEELKARVASK